MSFEEFISKLFSFDSFLIIDLKGRVIADEIIDKNERFFDVDILLLSYSHYSKKKFLSLSISKTTSCLFIYDFLKIRSYCLN